MNTTMCSRNDVELALERLVRIYPTMDVSSEAIEEWVGVLQRGQVTFTGLRTAVDQYLDADNLARPKPGAIRALAKAAEAVGEMAAAWSPRPEGEEHLCRSCGQRFRFAGIEVGPQRVLCCGVRCGCKDTRTGWRQDLDPWPENRPVPRDGGEGRVA